MPDPENPISEAVKVEAEKDTAEDVERLLNKLNTPDGSLIPLKKKAPVMRGTPVPDKPGFWVETVELDAVLATMSMTFEEKINELRNARMKIVRDALVLQKIPVPDDGSSGLTIRGLSRNGGLLVEVVRKAPDAPEGEPQA